jgi:two-component system response regulator YesN
MAVRRRTDANRVAQMRRYIAQNCTRNIRLKDISARFRISPGHVCRIFKEHLGVSFTKCLNADRIKEAKRLLKQTKCPAYVVAQKVGFRNRDYFFKVFKRIEGSTPDRYRYAAREKRA